MNAQIMISDISEGASSPVGPKVVKQRKEERERLEVWTGTHVMGYVTLRDPCFSSVPAPCCPHLILQEVTIEAFQMHTNSKPPSLSTD